MYCLTPNLSHVFQELLSVDFFVLGILAMPVGTCSSRRRRARRVAGGGARLGRGAARRGARIGRPPRLEERLGARSASAHVWRGRRWPVEVRGVSERGGTGAPVPGPSARLSAGPRRAPLSKHLPAAHLPRAPAARPPGAPRVLTGPRPGPAPRPPRAAPGTRRSAAEVRAAGVGPGRAGPGWRGDDEQVPKVAVQTQGERCRADPLPGRDRPLRGAADTPPATRRLANRVALPPSLDLSGYPPPPTPPGADSSCSYPRTRVHSLPRLPAARTGPSRFPVGSCVCPACTSWWPARSPNRPPPRLFSWVPERPLKPPSLQRQ